MSQRGIRCEPSPTACAKNRIEFDRNLLPIFAALHLLHRLSGMQKLRFTRHTAQVVECPCVNSPDSEPLPAPVPLSFDCVFVYLLRQSNVLGRLTSGSVRWKCGSPTVFDSYGYPIPYCSSDRLRSWAIFRNGALAPEFSRFDAEDLARLQSRALG